MKEFDDTKYTGDPAYNWQGEPGQEGIMETYAPFGRRVSLLHARSPRKIWTIMDAESFDGQIIVPGWRFVNRSAYFVSNEEWDSKDEEYVWFESNSEETAEKKVSFLEKWLGPKIAEVFTWVAE